MTLLLLIAALLSPVPTWADGGAVGPGDSKVEQHDNAARVWVYVDRKGQLHFVDRLELVPDAYRSRARQTSLVTTKEQRSEALSKAAQARRDARVKAAREALKQEAAARKAARDDAERRSKGEEDSERPPTRAEELADALTERRAVLEELVQFDDGFSEEPDATDAEVEARFDFLEKRLDALDARIREIQGSN